jgi:hypothetical protein
LGGSDQIAASIWLCSNVANFISAFCGIAGLKQTYAALCWHAADKKKPPLTTVKGGFVSWMDE